MPRGVKGSIDYDAKLAKINADIEKQNDTLEKLMASRNELLSKKQEADMKALYEYMQKKGLTADDVLARIQN